MSKELNLLQWENLRIRRNKDKKLILDGISGELHQGKSLAILGPSGSGKTTFLNYISKKFNPSGLTFESGDVRFIYNNKNQTKSFGFLSGYVTQDNILVSYMTPREHFRFSADLKLPKLTSKEKEELIDGLLERLNLGKCKDTMVGSVERKGLSGGEQKRTSIGYELITDPKVLFLDEPTTGLDVVSAKNIVEIITNEARVNDRIVIFTIHQPSSDINKLFDKLMILSEGKTIFFGQNSEALDFFSKQGFSCPKNFNPAEFYLNVLSNSLSTDIKRKSFDEKNKNLLFDKGDQSLDDTIADFKNLDEDDELHSAENIKLICSLEAANRENIALTALDSVERSAKQMTRETNNFINEFCILLSKNIKAFKRDLGSQLIRVFMILTNTILVLATFWNLQPGDNAIIDRAGCLFFLTQTIGNSNMQGNLLILNKEKLMFNKDQDNHMYRISTYYLARTILEIPYQFLSSILIFLILYFACNLNQEYFYKFALFVLVCFLSGYTSSTFSVFCLPVLITWR